MAGGKQRMAGPIWSSAHRVSQQWPWHLSLTLKNQDPSTRVSRAGACAREPSLAQDDSARKKVIPILAASSRALPGRGSIGARIRGRLGVFSLEFPGA